MYQMFDKSRPHFGSVGALRFLSQLDLEARHVLLTKQRALLRRMH